MDEAAMGPHEMDEILAVHLEMTLSKQLDT